jgi:hypothetical protein
MRFVEDHGIGGAEQISETILFERKIRELVAATRNRATKDVGAFLVNELLARATVRMAPPELLACEDAVFPPPKPARKASGGMPDQGLGGLY